MWLSYIYGQGNQCYRLFTMTLNEVKFLYFKRDETDENFQFQIIYAIRGDFIDLVCIFMLLTH